MTIYINGTTGISGVDGSAGTPAIIGSDADTGFVFSAGRIQASLNGTSANVGLVQETAKASTSGTSIDFTGIPSWVKRITVMFSGVSTNGTSIVGIQLGDSGGIETTGYTSSAYNTTGATAVAGTTASTALQPISGTHGATTTWHGQIVICLVNSSSNTWAFSGAFNDTASNAVSTAAGAKSLSATLDRIRITTVNGTDTFDAGSINILYE